MTWAVLFLAALAVGIWMDIRLLAPPKPGTLSAREVALAIALAVLAAAVPQLGCGGVRQLPGPDAGQAADAEDEGGAP